MSDPFVCVVLQGYRRKMYCSSSFYRLPNTSIEAERSLISTTSRTSESMNLYIMAMLEISTLELNPIGRNWTEEIMETSKWLSDIRLLRHLDLSWIDLEKVDLLQSIDRLSFLSSLHLVDCQLPRIISPSLHLTNFSYIPLSIIDLSYNSFTNSSIHKWLFNFSSSLAEIDISLNPLGGSIPGAFGNMMSLESSIFVNVPLKIILPKYLGQPDPWHATRFIAQVCYPDQIDLSSNRFKGPIPLFPHTSSMNLSKNMFSGSIISLYTIVTEHLQFLDLLDNLLSGEVPDCWINANNL
ncbi:hypothetical protein LguiA_002519 [Lonicera macranthoides]